MGAGHASLADPPVYLRCILLYQGPVRLLRTITTSITTKLPPLLLLPAINRVILFVLCLLPPCICTFHCSAKRTGVLGRVRLRDLDVIRATPRLVPASDSERPPGLLHLLSTSLSLSPGSPAAVTATGDQFVLLLHLALCSLVPSLLHYSTKQY
jgi:hypothetical protein